MTRLSPLLLAGLAVVVVCCSVAAAADYAWLEKYESTATIETRFPVPDGFERITVDSGGFGAWLRGLPLEPAGTEVRLHDGRLKENQSAHAAVIEIDIGSANLQQCADAVIRLHSEYFYACRLLDSIDYQFTSGDDMPFRKWIDGTRPDVDGNRVDWRTVADIDSSYRSFRTYLDTVFMYAGTLSLTRRLTPKEDPCKIAPGDLFMIPGSPGHTVIVVDIAEHAETGERLFLLAQGFMPAQNLHVLNNPMDSTLSPWYSCRFGDTLRTPEYTFTRDDLMQF